MTDFMWFMLGVIEAQTIVVLFLTAGALGRYLGKG